MDLYDDFWLGTCVIAMSVLVLWVDPTAPQTGEPQHVEPQNETAYVFTDRGEEDSCTPVSSAAGVSGRVSVIQDGQVVDSSSLTDGDMVDSGCRYRISYSTSADNGTALFQLDDSTVLQLGDWRGPNATSVMPTIEPAPAGWSSSYGNQP